MLKRIAPRCDRQYTFYDSNGEFTLRPMSANKERQIVFFNVNTHKSVNYYLSEFKDLYQNCFIREEEIIPGFLTKKEFRQSEKFYAVVRGRVDFYMTNKKQFVEPIICGIDGVYYEEFDNFGDAVEFLRNTDEYMRFIENHLTDEEIKIIQHYRKLSKEDKKSFHKSISIEE